METHDEVIPFNGHVIRGSTRQRIAEGMARRGERGATSAEIEVAIGKGHGTVSGALSRMHQDHEVELLAERRGGQQVYVHPAHVAGRETVDRTEFHCSGCRCSDGGL